MVLGKRKELLEEAAKERTRMTPRLTSTLASQYGRSLRNTTLQTKVNVEAKASNVEAKALKSTVMETSKATKMEKPKAAKTTVAEQVAVSAAVAAAAIAPLHARLSRSTSSCPPSIGRSRPMNCLAMRA